ncbi:TetR/AcrR family transcriptional regulator [Vagococcus sp.]|uniref:TetR/AcrR family transcriptional regulator n=1 Tax=Vagococcus sp. TaxID=1933889 RepID=UPI003FCECE32
MTYRKGFKSMPHDTFLNLSDKKKETIDHILLNTFFKKPISQVKVAEIVSEMKMSRGAFYKYFDDLEDAYTYIINQYALLIHQDIIKYIQADKNQFFDGIEKYLIWCSELDHETDYWKSLRLLTESNDLSAYKRFPLASDSPLLTQWTDILVANHIVMTDHEESVSFLFFIMELVMNSLTGYIANDWTTEELVKDYRFRVKWIMTGVTQ